MYTYTNGKLNVSRQTVKQTALQAEFMGKSFKNDAMLVFNGAPDAGTIVGGVGSKWGMMCTIVGPAPNTAVRKRGRAFDGQGRQYLVNNAVPTRTVDRMPFNDNGDLCTSGYA